MVMIATALSHYRILEKIGSGGMGDVYLAEDTRLDRRVALKILPEELAESEQRRARFQREAKSVAALNHPNIVTVYSVEEAEGIHFITMELIEGRTLTELIPETGMELGQFLEIAIPLSRAVAAAHAQGIVHRDLKPANVMVSDDGQVKILDFGLARSEGVGGVGIDTEAPTDLKTREGVVAGTVHYMSPEQAEGKPVDHQTDVFSLGVLFYEMATGRRPFDGDSVASVLASLLKEDPARFKATGTALPAEIESLVFDCLARDREARIDRTEDIGDRLERLAQGPTVRSGVPLVAVVTVAMVLLAVGGGWWWWGKRQADWVRNIALPGIAELVEDGDPVSAFLLLQDALDVSPEEPEIQRYREALEVRSSIRSDPPGALVSWKKYGEPGGEWHGIGVTPLDGAPVPGDYLRWRYELPGHQTHEMASHSVLALDVELVPDQVAAAHEGMVLVPAGEIELPTSETITLGEFWLDRDEVDNREFQEFVDAGGYDDPSFWKYPIVDGDRELGWEESRALFVDRTGRAGPATWELGSFPEGRADEPVQGVSWYEAAAYAEFRGRTLPTVFHHRFAALGKVGARASTQFGNFDGDGVVPVGSTAALDPFGTRDLGGNVREWCFNASGGNRYALGGSWQDPSYLFGIDLEARSPLDRAPTTGFRTAQYTGAVEPFAFGEVDAVVRDYSQEEPVSDEVFEFFRSLYAYDPAPLESAVEPLDTTEHYTSEEVSFRAAYGEERVPATLFLPRGVTPPFSAVVIFPSSASLHSEPPTAYQPFVDAIVRSGRACLVPIYQGTFSRKVNVHGMSASEQREVLIEMSQDLSRSIDYLESRDDIDASRLAFWGYSLGSRFSPVFDAVDDRFAANVMVAGGLYQGGEFFTIRPSLPEYDPFHFAPRSYTPTIMINGRHDFLRPVDTHQVPLLELLGAPDEDKKHVLFDSGHAPPQLGVIRETLSWLDRYLGPVERVRN